MVYKNKKWLPSVQLRDTLYGRVHEEDSVVMGIY